MGLFSELYEFRQSWLSQVNTAALRCFAVSINHLRKGLGFILKLRHAVLALIKFNMAA